MASRGTISPAEINALNAARRREENEGIARLAAQQRDWQAREARAAQEELTRRPGSSWPEPTIEITRCAAC
jgi:hypothetical protein